MLMHNERLIISDWIDQKKCNFFEKKKVLNLERSFAESLIPLDSSDVKKNRENYAIHCMVSRLKKIGYKVVFVDWIVKQKNELKEFLLKQKQINLGL